jgi:hypothetical protein
MCCGGGFSHQWCVAGFIALDGILVTSNRSCSWRLVFLFHTLQRTVTLKSPKWNLNDHSTGKRLNWQWFQPPGGCRRVHPPGRLGLTSVSHSSSYAAGEPSKSFRLEYFDSHVSLRTGDIGTGFSHPGDVVEFIPRVGLCLAGFE